MRWKVIDGIASKQDLLGLARTYGVVCPQADDVEGDGVVSIQPDPEVNKYAYSRNKNHDQ